MSALHNVLRYLVRGQGHGSPQIERDLLESIDADEQGFSDLDTYRAAQEQKRREEAAQAAKDAGEQPVASSPSQLSDEQLQAELDRRAALKKAQEGGAQRPAAPAATS